MFRANPDSGAGLCLTPALEVRGHDVCDSRVVPDHPQHPIASVAEEVSGDATVVAVIDDETAVEVRWATTDPADAPLGGHLGFELGVSDSVVPSESPASAVLGVPFSGACTEGFSVLLSVGHLLGSSIGLAGPISTASGDKINLGPTPKTPCGLVLGVDVLQEVLIGNLTTALPSVLSGGVTANCDLPTQTADGPVVLGIDSREGMAIRPHMATMALDVVHGFATDQLPASGGLRGDGGSLSTPAMTEAIGDLALGIAA